MALGLIGGSMVAGVGKAGEKYIDMEEKKRAEAQRVQDQMAVTGFAAEKGREMKQRDVEDQRARMSAFREEATAWRAENPKASVNDFVEHFATSEYSDLLKPTIEAAGLKMTGEVKEAQSKESEARRGLIGAQTEESKARKEYTEGAKTEAERMRAEAAKTRAEKGAAGGKSKGDLSEKDFQASWRDMAKANPLTNPDTGEPDLTAQAQMGDLYKKLYDETGSLTIAESYAVKTIKAAQDFAAGQAKKAGASPTPSQWSAWLEQGSQRYLQQLADQRKAAREKPATSGATGKF